MLQSNDIRLAAGCVLTTSSPKPEIDQLKMFKNAPRLLVICPLVHIYQREIRTGNRS